MLKVYQALAWGNREDALYKDLTKKALDSIPSGSGFDSKAIVKAQGPKRILIHGGFHCMNQDGYYDGWINFKVIVTPDLVSTLRVQVQAKGMRWPARYEDIRDYIYEVYDEWLNSEV